MIYASKPKTAFSWIFDLFFQKIFDKKNELFFAEKMKKIKI